MTDGPFTECFAPYRARTMASCLRSAEEQLRERPFHLSNLVEETITGVEHTPHGTRIRCASGVAVIIERGHIFDPAGNPVIEP